ncbi:MAG: hypothetical protein IPP16_13040 [Acidimicrobiaceae bacterium]|nr:hypothetical protein [Acidimicrobiaceae bacterium]
MARGTRDAPVAAGEIADIGGGWRLQVLGVTPDAAALVAAENEFNDPPPAGSTFTLVSVAMGYFGLEDPKAAYEPSVSALGGSSVELESGCGSIPDELIVFNDLFAGGVLVGNLCFVTTPADAAGLQLYATGDFFSSDDAVFLEVAQPAAATAMAGLRGPQDGADSTPGRLQPTPLNTAAEVGDGWSVTVSSGARDITDSVLAENSFNGAAARGLPLHRRRRDLHVQWRRQRLGLHRQHLRGGRQQRAVVVGLWRDLLADRRLRRRVRRWQRGRHDVLRGAQRRRHPHAVQQSRLRRRAGDVRHRLTHTSRAAHASRTGHTVTRVTSRRSAHAHRVGCR